MVLANLLGYAHSNDVILTQDAAGLELANFKYDFTPVEDLRSLLERAGKGEQYIADLELELDIKVRTVVLLDYYDSMERLKTIIEKNIAEGQSIEEFIQAVGADNLMSDIGIAKNNAWYLNNVYRTNMFLAHNNGKFVNGMENPNVTKFEYMAIEDGRTTVICEELNGTIRDKNDSFWLTYTPPNHFQCRSELIEITDSYAQATGLEDVLKDPSEKAILESGGQFLNSSVNGDAWIYPTKDMRTRLGGFVAAPVQGIPF